MNRGHVTSRKCDRVKMDMIGGRKRGGRKEGSRKIEMKEGGRKGGRKGGREEEEGRMKRRME